MASARDAVLCAMAELRRQAGVLIDEQVLQRTLFIALYTDGGERLALPPDWAPDYIVSWYTVYSPMVSEELCRLVGEGLAHRDAETLYRLSERGAEEAREACERLGVYAERIRRAAEKYGAWSPERLARLINRLLGIEEPVERGLVLGVSVKKLLGFAAELRKAVEANLTDPRV